jgi:hypothetical protein
VVVVIDSVLEAVASDCNALLFWLRAGEDTGRYRDARHGILGVVRRELSRMRVKYTVHQQSYMPVLQQATTPLM